MAATVIELICVVSIISLLLALLAPSIQVAREAARSASCGNHLRQIGLATLNYESARGRLPPGNLGFPHQYSVSREVGGTGSWYDSSSDQYWKRAQHSSALTLLLPYLDNATAYNSLPTEAVNTRILYGDSPESLNQWIGDLDSVSEIATTPLSLFLCPTDFVSSGDSVALVTAQISIDSVSGNDVLVAEPSLWKRQQPAATNYVGCAGAHSGGVWAKNVEPGYSGAMTNDRDFRFSKITDGTSNTVIFGENIGSIFNSHRRFHCSWAFGALARGRGGLPWRQNIFETQPEFLILGDNRYSYPAGFGSMHPDNVKFLLADGSVQSISRLVDVQTLYSLCGVADGESVNAD